MTTYGYDNNHNFIDNKDNNILYNGGNGQQEQLRK